MDKQAQFKTLWNLAFYDGFSDMYFYFNSLRKPWPKHPQYNARAEWIGAEATAMLNQLPSFATDSSSFELGYLYDLIQFMEQAVESERQAEAAYFKNRIKQLNSPLFKDIPEVQELMEEFNKSSEEFNYKNVIPLINLIYQGLDNTKAIAKSETQHIEDIEKAMKQIRGDDETSTRYKILSGLWTHDMNTMGPLQEKYSTFKKFLEASNKKREREIMVTYTEHKNLVSDLDSTTRKLIPGVKKWLANNEALKSTDVKIGNWITASVNDIINNQATFDAIVEVCQTKYNFNSNSQTQVEKAVKAFLIKGITIFATQHISEILNDTYKNQNIDELARLIINSIQIVDNVQIEGLYENFGQFGKTLKLFENANTTKQLQEQTQSAEGLYEAYKNFRTELNRLKKSKTQKETQAQKLLKKGLKTGKETDEYKEIYSLIRKLETLEKKINKYKNNDKKIQEAINEWNEKPINLKDTSGETISIKISLNPDGTFNLNDLRQNLKDTELMSKLGGAGKKAKTLSTFITRLKSKTSTTLKDDIINIIAPLANQAQKQGLGGEEFVIDSIKRALQNMKISVGGPAFSEVKQGLQESLNGSKDFLHWTGKLNRKNDFITISINWEKPNFQNALKKATGIRAASMIENSRDMITQVSNIFFKNFQDTFYNTINDLNKQDSTVNSYKNNTEAFFSALEKRNQALEALNSMELETNKELQEYASEIKTLDLEKNDLYKQRQAIIKGIENSFYLSSTMKTYNQYQDKIGFVGGSMGATVLEQLDNFAELLSNAGMPLSTEDFEWLYSAIINCSPVSLVGEKNKNIIEDYLGSMAAFALFDEGGAEAQIVNNILHNVKNQYTTPQILHLYVVNGIYHPGSYVLQEVVNELRECINNTGLAYESTRKGAGITIINTMNEGMIPNRGKKISYDQNGKPFPIDTDPWGTVANRTWDAVSIKILFLAGLLDTVRNINEKLGNIELPT